MKEIEKQKPNKNNLKRKQQKILSIKRDPPNVTLMLSEAVKWPIDYMKLVWI